MTTSDVILFILLLGMIILLPVGADSPLTGSDTITVDLPAAVENGSPVTVGILVMKSGFIADIGTEYTRAFDMVKQDNPDSLIHPIVMDGGSERAVAVDTWGKMKNSTPDLPVVVTVASWTSNVVYPDAADSGIIQIALGSAAVNRTRSSDHLIRFTPGVSQESPVLASYLKQFNRIAVIGGDNDYSREYFAALDTLLPGKIVLNSRYDQNHVESTLNISAITQADPDVLLLLSVSEGGNVVDLLRTAGITAPLVGTRTIERNSLAETTAAEGLIFTTPALNSSHPFFTRYREKYGTNATFYGAEAYDAFTTLYSSVAACGNAPECIYSWYDNRSYNGTLGSVNFKEPGIATYPIGFKIVHDGTFEDYQV